MNLRYLLNNSRDHARTIGELSESLKVSRREVEQAVQDARLDGVPIVSASEGLWIGTDEEALAWCEKQRSRAIHLMESAQGVQRGVEARRAIRAGQEGFPWAA
jgi:predicted DNA-binding transcriptional regulator YafY